MIDWILRKIQNIKLEAFNSKMRAHKMIMKSSNVELNERRSGTLRMRIAADEKSF